MAANSAAVQHVFVFPPHIYQEGKYEPAEYHLQITNPTDSPIRFAHTRASCGCAVTKLHKQELPPAEATTLDVMIDHRGTVGMRTVFIALIDDAGTAWQYTLKAAAFPRIRVEPADVYAGELPPRTLHERKATICTYAMRGDTPPLPQVGKVDTPNVSVTVGDSQIESIDHEVTRRRTQLLVRIDAPPVAEPRLTAISLECPDVDAAPPFTTALRVHWSVKSRFRIWPERLFLGVQRGTRVRRDVSIERTDGAPFRITGVTTTDSAVSCQLASAQRQSVWTLTVDIDVSKVQGPLWTKIIMHVDNTETPTLVLPVSLLRERT
jgi:hypothetical protein